MTAYIGLGANLGTDEEIVSRFRAAARGLGHLGEVTSSSIYRTSPVGPVANQPDFLNAVLKLEPKIEIKPLILLGHLHAIETTLGRCREIELASGPRAIDLDLLLVDDVALSEPTLSLPHPRMHERAFVLVPLAELATDTLKIPGQSKDLRRLLASVDTSSTQRLSRGLFAA